MLNSRLKPSLTIEHDGADLELDVEVEISMSHGVLAGIRLTVLSGTSSPM